MLSLLVVAQKAFDRKLDEITALRLAPPEAAAPRLKAALNDRSNLIAAKAASITGDLELRELIPEMTAAFDRFLADPVKTDPKCWAKLAIVKALKGLGYPGPDTYLAGVRHVQLEPVFNGSEDTAIEVRVQCAFALMECSSLTDPRMLRILVDLLADSAKTVRGAAAKCLGQMDRTEAALLIRLKILNGDEAAEVMGECFSAMLRLEPREGIALVARFLDSGDYDLPFEAVAALAESHEVEAFEYLRSTWRSSHDRDLRRSALLAMGASRQPEAIEFLISLIGQQSVAGDALRALAPVKSNEEIRRKVEAAVKAADNEVVRAAFAREF